MIGDGGMQNIAMDAIVNGVIPVVVEGWNPSTGMAALPIPNDTAKMDHDEARQLLVHTLVRLCNCPAAELTDMQKANWDWIWENRDPKTLCEKFSEEFMPKVIG
jgi:hypothetical protein